MSFLRELSMAEIVSRLAAMLIYAGLQGGLLAVLSLWLGDRRPQHEGRLSINPFNHLTAWGAFSAALFGLSWIRSIWFDPAANRFGRPGAVVVLVLGLAGMAALVPVVDMLRPLALLLPTTGGYAVLSVLSQLQLIALGSAVLNLLPIPGLVGGGVWQIILPDQERRLRRLEPICMAVLIAAIVAGLLPNPAPWLLPGLQRL